MKAAGEEKKAIALAKNRMYDEISTIRLLLIVDGVSVLIRILQC